jgi:hypothetical protein
VAIAGHAVERIDERRELVTTRTQTRGSRAGADFVRGRQHLYGTGDPLREVEPQPRRATRITGEHQKNKVAAAERRLLTSSCR